jgi:hypothetical protein
MGLISLYLLNIVGWKIFTTNIHIGKVVLSGSGEIIRTAPLFFAAFYQKLAFPANHT